MQTSVSRDQDSRSSLWPLNQYETWLVAFYLAIFIASGIINLIIDSGAVR